jgi:hypothetical protein
MGLLFISMECNKIVKELISDRLTEMVEELSTNEFRDQVGDTIFEKTGESLDTDELEDIIFQSVHPLMMKVVEYMGNTSFDKPE